MAPFRPNSPRLTVWFAVASVTLGATGSTQTAWTSFPVVGTRYSHAMAYDSVHQRVFLMGGTKHISNSSELWTWDGQRWTHQKPRKLPEPRVLPGLAYDSRRDRLVLFGGSGSGQSRWLGDTWEWDGSDWRLLTPSRSPTPRWSPEMVYDEARQRVVMFGGYTSAGAFSSETWEWDGLNWTQGPTSAVPPRVGHRMAYDSVRRLTVLFGGDAPSTVFGDTWEYNGLAWTRRLSPLAPSPRSGHAMVFDAARNETVLFGGSGAPNQIYGDTWTWDGRSWSRRSPPTSPPPSVAHSAAYDAARAQVVVFGGQVPDGQGGFPASGDTWEWDGLDWRLARAFADPLARSGTDLAFDGTGVLLVGGLSPSGVCLGDTWRWNGTAWDPLPNAGAPRRCEHRVVYDSGRRRVVLFGGADGVNLMNDTWEWDGTSWAVRNLPSAPSPRSDHALAYDSHRRRVVLFAGYGGGNLWDTWEYDGASWTRFLSPSPSPRVGAGMAYDPIRRRTVLFGGGFWNSWFSVTPYADTWEWDGARWTARTPALSPPARYGHGLTWDGTRNRIVLAGGWRSGQPTHTDVWEWDGQVWVERLPSPTPVDARRPGLAYDPILEQSIFFTGQGTGDTWTYATTYPARFSLHYPSCRGAGVGGVLTADDARPWLGEPFDLRLTGIPPSSMALLLLGFSPTLLFGQIPLPLDLSTLGLTGCTLYTDVAVTLPMLNTGGTATLALPIPASPNFAGGAFYLQGLFSNLAANPAGLLTTNAAAGVIGWK